MLGSDPRDLGVQVHAQCPPRVAHVHRLAGEHRVPGDTVGADGHAIAIRVVGERRGQRVDLVVVLAVEEAKLDAGGGDEIEREHGLVEAVGAVQAGVHAQGLVPDLDAAVERVGGVVLPAPITPRKPRGEVLRVGQAPGAQDDDGDVAVLDPAGSAIDEGHLALVRSERERQRIPADVHGGALLRCQGAVLATQPEPPSIDARRPGQLSTPDVRQGVRLTVPVERAALGPLGHHLLVGRDPQVGLQSRDVDVVPVASIGRVGVVVVLLEANTESRPVAEARIVCGADAVALGVQRDGVAPPAAGHLEIALTQQAIPRGAVGAHGHAIARVVPFEPQGQRVLLVPVVGLEETQLDVRRAGQVEHELRLVERIAAGGAHVHPHPTVDGGGPAAERVGRVVAEALGLPRKAVVERLVVGDALARPSDAQSHVPVVDQAVRLEERGERLVLARTERRCPRGQAGLDDLGGPGAERTLGGGGHEPVPIERHRPAARLVVEVADLIRQAGRREGASLGPTEGPPVERVDLEPIDRSHRDEERIPSDAAIPVVDGE